MGRQNDNRDRTEVEGCLRAIEGAIERVVIDLGHLQLKFDRLRQDRDEAQERLFVLDHEYQS